jgi:hypothetical protein
MRLAAIRALEIRDEAAIIHGMTCGKLEAPALEAERVPASAPPDVARQLRLTAQAEADAWQQYADAALQRDRTQAANAGTLARQLATERQQLEAANARYVQWSAVTSSTTEAAASARDELKRRSLTWKPAELSQRQMAAPEPHVRSGSDRQLAQIDRLLAQAAAAAGRVVGEHAERESRAEYTARAERGAQAQSVPALETRAQYDAEMEL